MYPRRSATPRPQPPVPREGTFVAIDFETADYQPDSACAVGLVRVEKMQITERMTVLIRPPRQQIHFTHIHGITWSMVQDLDTFAAVWPKLSPMLNGASVLAAHNAPFDRKVLLSCCAAARLVPPDLPFLCTVQLARRRWALPRNDLKTLCRCLGIPLNHHEAGSDAEACARIVMAASAPTTLGT
jgi:DNA polymerase III subunit epsilon